LSVRPPIVGGAALVIPRGLLERLRGERDQPASAYGRETRFVKRRAVEAVMAAEWALGRTPHEMPHNNPSYDVRSLASDGSVIRIEVRGRVEGEPDVTITHNELLTAKNLGHDYRLALVEVSDAAPHGDQLRYLIRPFDAIGPEDFRITKLVLDWPKLWSQGGAPS
jgi:Protein NO VEIN, C-terminal